jgi:hypothetical protein
MLGDDGMAARHIAGRLGEIWETILQIGVSSAPLD